MYPREAKARATTTTTKGTSKGDLIRSSRIAAGLVGLTLDERAGSSAVLPDSRADHSQQEEAHGRRRVEEQEAVDSEVEGAADWAEAWAAEERGVEKCTRSGRGEGRGRQGR